MSKFSKFKRHLRLRSSFGHPTRKDNQTVAHNHTASSIQNQRLKTKEKISQEFTKDMIKPFLIDLLKFNKRFKGINSHFVSLERKKDPDTTISQSKLSQEFKSAVLAKFKKSDKLSLTLFRTITLLDHELKTLKELLSKNNSIDLSAQGKAFEIDLMTDSVVNDLEYLGITPQYSYPAYIYILDNSRDMDTILDTVLNKSKGIKGGLRVVGLDVETGFRKNHSSFPSILQIAISKDIVIIFQLYRLCFAKLDCSPDLDVIPDKLKKFLSSPSVLKVGVNIRGDAQQLEKYAGLSVSNSLCLQDMGNVLSLKRCSLQHLSNAYTGIRLEKGRGHYEWDSPKNAFSHRSAEYAANDAISSLLIFRKMLNMPQSAQKNTFLRRNNVESTNISRKEGEISNDTQFIVHIPRKLKKRPPYLEKTKYIEILRQITGVAQKNLVSFAKLVRIILDTCMAFPKDDPLSKIKTRNLIFHMIDEGILMKK